MPQQPEKYVFQGILIEGRLRANPVNGIAHSMLRLKPALHRRVQPLHLLRSRRVLRGKSPRAGTGWRGAERAQCAEHASVRVSIGRRGEQATMYLKVGG